MFRVLQWKTMEQVSQDWFCSNKETVSMQQSFFNYKLTEMLGRLGNTGQNNQR